LLESDTGVIGLIERGLIQRCVVGGVFLLGTLPAAAIDLQPGDVKPLPLGTSFSQLSLRISDFGGFYVDGQKTAASIDLSAMRYQFRLGHFFEVSNVPAVAYIQTGLANIDVDNIMPGRDAGPEDTLALLALWPYADHATQTYFGVGAYGVFPTGSYDSDQGVFNVGENRYAAALQLAFQTSLAESLVVVAAIDGVWFGSNEDFTAARLTLDQDALYTAQLGLTYQATQLLSVSANYFFTWGGETAIDGLDQDNANELHRHQVSVIAQLPVGRLMLQYGGDLQRECGFFEEQRAIVRFGQLIWRVPDTCGFVRCDLSRVKLLIGKPFTEPTKATPPQPHTLTLRPPSPAPGSRPCARSRLDRTRRLERAPRDRSRENRRASSSPALRPSAYRAAGSARGVAPG